MLYNLQVWVCAASQTLEKSSAEMRIIMEEEKKTEDVCQMCRRSESKAGKMIKIQKNICICVDCMQKSLDMMNSSNLPPYMDFAFQMPGQGQNDVKIQDIPENQKLKKQEATEKSAEKKEQSKGLPDKLPAPHIIKAHLDEFVVGQERAKKILSVGVYNHYKRVRHDDNASGVEIEKSNMLMIGPTGCGKTYLVKTLAKILNVPLAITDATTLTEAGYIGDDVESVVSKLLAAADNDVKRAETGIIFIDEIDKIAKKRNTNSRDVSGESVQQGLLKLLEGSEIEVPVGATNKNAMVPMATVNTKNILFICGGAFPDLDKIIKERLNESSSMGFNADLKDKYDEDENLIRKVTAEDLREYGMIPEFLGRLPIVYTLDGLDEKMLADILSKPKNAIIRQYRELFAMDEVDLLFEDDALLCIAKEALKKKMGARALRAIIEDIMLDIMYEIPKDDGIGRVKITKDYIENRGMPVIEMRGAAY